MGTVQMAKYRRSSQSGFSMIEILVALIITLIGLLGLAGLMVQAHSSELESYQRAQALILLQAMVDRIQLNHTVATCYANSGGAFFGTGTSIGFPVDCTAGTPSQQARADDDMQLWQNELDGTSESKSGVSVGAMVGARGCVVEEDTVNQIYRISVTWQGKTKTVDPTVLNPTYTCASGQYGDENLRRIVTTTIRIAKLS